MDHWLNYKTQMYKISGENIEENTYNLETRQKVLRCNTKGTIHLKIVKLDVTGIKCFCCVKHITLKMKEQTTGWGKYL